ncbi:MAG: hypothetical protein MH204_00695 [Fimbriimonadaceae bacterium]|nr:hypothetical protein [Fimbriimonadaceae bacterium]
MNETLSVGLAGPAMLGGNAVIQAVLAGVGFLVLVLVLVGFIRLMLIICPPNQVLVISGFGKRRPKFVLGGLAFRIPGLQRVDRMSLSLMEVPIGVRNAYSQGGIAMNIEAIANVKVSSDQNVIGNAIERFLNRDLGEVRRVAKETLEGHLRGVVANLTPEQVNEDRLTFAENLAKETEEDLRKLGLHLDTFKILHVSDEVGYLDATGRKAIAAVIRSAEIAESDSKRSAEQAESQNAGRSSVSRSNVDAKVVALQNQLRTIRAEIDSRVKSEEEITAAAAREARAKAEQELQAVRAQLEALRLEVDEVLPAEANRMAREFLARGEAAMIRERGRAVSEALDVLYGAWQKAGPSAKQIALIEELDTIMKAAADGVNRVKVKKISVIDGGSGQTLPNYLAAYPQMLNSVFQAVDQAVGINIPDSISGRDTAKAKEEEK